jgi:prepilin peptidase CpaA
MAVSAEQLLVAAALLMTLAAALFDWRTGAIPRWLSIGLLPVAPVLHALALRSKHGPFGLPGPLFGAVLSIIGLLLCAIVPYVMFRLRMLGGGDVKVLASLGALLGPHLALTAEFYALVLAALYAPTRLAYRGRLFSTLGSSTAALVSRFLPREHRRSIPDAMLEGVRFSPFVFLGTVAALFAPPLLSRVAP